MAQTWLKQWKEGRCVVAGLVDWNKFVTAFLDRFFPCLVREEKVKEFINLEQGNMSIKEYFCKLTQLFKYFLEMVAEPRSRISKLILSVSKLVGKECRTTILVWDMNVYR